MRVGVLRRYIQRFGIRPIPHEPPGINGGSGLAREGGVSVSA
ncbi:hypothetical protein C4J83_1921 [Pseudomonas sp. LBUM920]|nr:hypothetical protein C4J83_1921 [Pseudomonas sp. LBUM920]